MFPKPNKLSLLLHDKKTILHQERERCRNQKISDTGLSCQLLTAAQVQAGIASRTTSRYNDTMTKILETYGKEMATNRNHSGACTQISQFFNGFRIDVPPEAGTGWNEVLEIDSGLCFSLSNYLSRKTIHNSFTFNHSPLRFNIMLKGSFDLQLDSTTRHTVFPGDIWVWNDLTGNILRTIHPEQEICGVTLTFPPHLVEAWLGNVSCDISRNLEKIITFSSSHHGNPAKQIFPLVRQIPQANQIMCMARNLFRFERDTLYGKLHFESLALEFLSALLNLDFGKSGNKEAINWKTRAAVDEAVDILHEEWVDPPSISALARRVGINESYLKNGFRIQVGCTIGEFIRQKRMEKAMELIESGKYSIMEIALFVGYTNPSHFAAVFKKFYGNVPSYYVQL